MEDSDFTKTLQAAASALGDPALAEAQELLKRQSQERVAELRQRYLNGTYELDASEISKKMIDEHLR